MKLSSLIVPELVLLKRRGETKDALIDELIREIYHTRQKISIPELVVRKAVYDRESLGGTVLPSGLAVPHARLEGFDDILIAVGVPALPPQHDNTPIRMMILILTSQSASTLYLNTLAAFTKISMAPSFEKLREAANPQSFIQLLKDANIEVTQELRVSAIMHQSITALHPDNTLKDAADMFYKNRLSYLPILDSGGNFVGELTVLDLFAVGVPDYASKLGNLKFLNDFEPFEELLKKETTIPIRQVMKKPAITLEEDSSAIEAIVKFTKSNRRYIPVVKKDNQLAGVVSYMDILQKVLRA